MKEEEVTAPTRRRKATTPRLGAARRAQLRAELEQELQRLMPEAALVADARARSELAQALDARSRSRALPILDALRRMETGAFGRCAGCRATISYERLSAIPETTVCAECSWSRELSFRR
jgi:DnaK suppressor protein